MAKYQKKPLQIDAVRCTEAEDIETLEGTMRAEPGDWIITGVEGEQYPCKDSVFCKSYDRVVDAPTKVVTLTFPGNILSDGPDEAPKTED